MAVYYEWVVETVELDSEDIIDTEGCDNLERALELLACDPGEGHYNRLVLVRDKEASVNRYGDEDRQWAYVEDGELPLEFDGGAKVPEKYRKQYRDRG